MAEFSIWQSSIVDTAGNIQAGAAVEVRDEDTGNLATLFSDEAGTTPLANPFTADSEGFAFFYIEPSEVRIKCGTGSAARTLRHVKIPSDLTTEQKQDLIDEVLAEIPVTTIVHNDLLLRDAAGAHPAESIDVDATPTNYTPMDGTVEGHFEGVDAALATAQTQTTDEVFAYPSAYATFAEVMAAIQAKRFTDGARAFIRVDAGHTIDEQFIFENGDYRHIVIDQAGRTSIRNATYRWTKIGATNEYYCELAAGGNPTLTEPKIVRAAFAPLNGGIVKGTVGALAAGQWGYGASGAGFNTIIIRMPDDSDPDTAADDSITYENRIKIVSAGFIYPQALELFNQYGYLGALPWLVVANAVGPTLDLLIDGDKATNNSTNHYGFWIGKASLHITRYCGIENLTGRNACVHARIFMNYGKLESDAIGLQAIDSDLFCLGSFFTTTTGYALQVYGTTVYGDGMTTACTTGRCVYVARASTVAMGSSVNTASNSANDVIIATEASRISAQFASCVISAGNGNCWVADKQSSIDCRNATGTESGSGYGFKVMQGSFLNATEGTGSLSQTKNSFSSNGSIFQP